MVSLGLSGKSLLNLRFFLHRPSAGLLRPNDCVRFKNPIGFMIQITFPDGAVKEFPENTSSLDIAKSISEQLAKKVLAAEVNGQVWDASRPLKSDASLKLLTWNDAGGKSTFWHSSAHLLAEAVESLYPGVKFWVGPPVENGFYYDMDLGGRRISEEDLR